MKASIIMPLLRQNDAWLRQSVLSALNQTEACEVLVVTAAATPETNRALLRQLQPDHPQLRVVEQPPGEGFAAALNYGIRQASAGRFGFLLTDDWLQPQAVEHCLAHDADLVSTARTVYAADGLTVLPSLGGHHTAAAYRKLKHPADRAGFLGHFFLFRRAAIAQAGGLDETLGDSPGIDDFDLIWTLLEQGASVAIVEQSLYCMRDHDGDRLTRQHRDAMFATFHRILDKHGVSGRQRQALLRHHGRWFGRSMLAVYQEISGQVVPAPPGPLRRLYRATVPFEIRVAIHEFIRKADRSPDSAG